MIKKSIEWRWALIHSKEGFLLGKYCWPNATGHEPVIPTFKTRKQARNAKKLLRAYRFSSRIMKISVEYCI